MKTRYRTKPNAKQRRFVVSARNYINPEERETREFVDKLGLKRGKKISAKSRKR